MTAIGSSNYGYRSVFRDLEAQFFIFTSHPGLSQVDALQQGSLPVCWCKCSGLMHRFWALEEMLGPAVATGMSDQPCPKL